RVAFARKQNVFPIRTPARRNVRAGMPGELPRATAIRGNDVDVPVAITFARERDPISVRRKQRISVRLQMRSNRLRPSAARIRDPNIATINEREPLAVGA